MKVAMVLAAGLGTRLRPLTDHVPKPLCPVGDRPQIDHILEALARGGIERAVVNTHHLHEQFSDAWASAQLLEIVRIHEPDILGTGGGIANAASALGDGPVLVWNADILTTFDIPKLLESARAPVTLVVGPRLPKGEGTVGITTNGALARVRSARTGEETYGADYAGIAVLSKSARDRLPVPGCLIGDLVVPLVERGEEIDTFALDKPFRDTGTLAEYLEANLAFLSDRNQPFINLGDCADAISLERSIVGKSARVEGSGEVRETVIWPSTVAHAPLERTIATPFGCFPA